jgi:hypothetical protein
MAALSAPMIECTWRRYEREAAPLLEQLVAVRAGQMYCRHAARRSAPRHALAGGCSGSRETGTPALDAYERRLLCRLAELRARFGIVVQ